VTKPGNIIAPSAHSAVRFCPDQAFEFATSITIDQYRITEELGDDGRICALEVGTQYVGYRLAAGARDRIIWLRTREVKLAVRCEGAIGQRRIDLIATSGHYTTCLQGALVSIAQIVEAGQTGIHI
jgi:hypothetical protein